MHAYIHLFTHDLQHRAIVLELEGRVSELQCDNLRMEQRLLDMEYSSYSSTRRIEDGGGDSSRGSSSRGMTLIDDVLRDYSRRTQFVDDNDDHDHHHQRRSSDVDDVNAVKRKSIVDVMDESRDKVCMHMFIQCCLVCLYSSIQS